MPWSKTSSFALTTVVSKNQFHNLTPDDVAKLFGSLSKKELQSLLNPDPLSTLEKEHQHYHLRLKFISKPNMDRLISLGATTSRLKTVTPLPCLSCLLENARPKPWCTKDDLNHARPSHSIAPGHSMSMDQLTSTTPAINPQLTGRLTNTHIVGV